MKSSSICLLITTAFFLACGQETKPPSSTLAPTKEQMRAKSGEEVWVIVTHVKSDQKPAFEQWVKEIFYPALHKSQKPMNKEQLQSTRWLEPAAQNEDKTWTYVWIMDPVVPKGDYDIPTLLNTAYGEEKGKAHWEAYMAFWAKPVDMHVLKQTAY